MRALVLSGGGVKGAYQVGALRRIISELNTEYDIYCGVSVGAINSAFLSQYNISKNGYEKLLESWNQVNQTNVKRSWGKFWDLLGRIWSPLSYMPSLWKSSVYDSSPLQEWICTIKPNNIINSGKLLRVLAVSYNTGMSYIASETNENILSWVIASSAFPVFLTPIQINNQLWTDGGVRSVTPLGEAIELGADDIDVIICSPENNVETFTPKEAVPGLAIRTIDILSDQVMTSDLKLCGLKNELVELKPKYRKVNVRILRPESSLNVDSLDFSQTTIQRLINKGYEDACTRMISI